MPQVSRLERIITAFFRDPKFACTVTSFNELVIATGHLHSLMVLPMPLHGTRREAVLDRQGEGPRRFVAGSGRGATRNGGPRRGFRACKLTLFAIAESERVPCQRRDAPAPWPGFFQSLVLSGP